MGLGIKYSKYRFALYAGDGQPLDSDQPIKNLLIYFDEYTARQLIQTAISRMNTIGSDIAYFAMYGVAIYKKGYR